MSWKLVDKRIVCVVFNGPDADTFSAIKLYDFAVVYTLLSEPLYAEAFSISWYKSVKKFIVERFWSWLGNEKLQKTATSVTFL